MDLSQLDIVYPVRPGNMNEELRYSLRSLENFPHRNVWILGTCPQWVQNATLIKGPQTKDKRRNVQTTMLQACKTQDISDPFILFNDDFFVLEPIEDLPHYHRGTTDDYLTERRALRNTLSQYDLRNKTTQELLMKHGFEKKDVLCYELHVPMIVWKSQWVAAHRIACRQQQSRGNERVQMRTMYGNWAGLGGEWFEDPKIRRPEDTIPEGPFLSTTDRLFSSTRSYVRKFLRDQFPHSSQYEGNPNGNRRTNNRHRGGNGPWKVVQL